MVPLIHTITSANHRGEANVFESVDHWSLEPPGRPKGPVRPPARDQGLLIVTRFSELVR